MGKQAKPFREGEEPPFKTPEKPTDRGRGKGCKLPEISPIKTRITHQSHASSRSLSRAERSERGSLSRGSSVNSDTNDSVSSLIRYHAHAQKSLKGLQGAVKRYADQFINDGQVLISLHSSDPSVGTLSDHHPAGQLMGLANPAPPHQSARKRPAMRASGEISQAPLSYVTAQWSEGGVPMGGPSIMSGRVISIPQVSPECLTNSPRTQTSQLQLDRLETRLCFRKFAVYAVLSASTSLSIVATSEVSWPAHTVINKGSYVPRYVPYPVLH
ncbi:hypothetical protein MMC12_007623 [Toensbergia leucococca]|nr:hypothetical protein [Toensbergia leucococca]